MKHESTPKDCLRLLTKLTGTFSLFQATNKSEHEVARDTPCQTEGASTQSTLTCCNHMVSQLPFRDNVQSFSTTPFSSPAIFIYTLDTLCPKEGKIPGAQLSCSPSAPKGCCNQEISHCPGMFRKQSTTALPNSLQQSAEVGVPTLHAWAQPAPQMLGRLHQGGPEGNQHPHDIHAYAQFACSQNRKPPDNLFRFGSIEDKTLLQNKQYFLCVHTFLGIYLFLKE